MSRVKTSHGLVCIVAVVLWSAGASIEAADYHSQVNSPLQNTSSVNSYQTTGADMAGMAVTAFFSAAPAETVIWQATGATSGAATGADNDWNLGVNGDTFVSPWTLTYSAAASPVNKGLLVGFSIDGFAAGPGEIGVMFDRTFDWTFGTPGSFLGWDYETLAPLPPFDTYVTYRGAVGVAGNAPVGDEFRWLTARFLIPPGVDDEFSTVPPTIAGLDGVNLGRLQFRQDTNNPIVPEPASVTLLLGGLALALVRRRARG